MYLIFELYYIIFCFYNVVFLKIFYLVNFKYNCGVLKIFWLYGGVLECKDYLILGKVFLIICVDLILDEFFCDVFLY